jgi:hypothetical protein
MMFKFISGQMTMADLDKQVEEMKRGLGKPVQTAEPTFGAKLKEATKRKLGGASYSRIQASTSAAANDDESFGNKLRKAVQKHPKSKEQTQKNAGKDRARYLS